MSVQAPPAPETEAPVEASQPSVAAGWYENPTGPGQRYWDGMKWTDSYSPPVAKKAGWRTSSIVLGYFFASLGGLLGLIFGISAVFNSDSRTRKHGIAIIALSVIATIFWIAVLSG